MVSQTEEFFRMINSRLNRTIACGMILAAVAVFPALSQDLPPAEFDQGEPATRDSQERGRPAANRSKPMPPQPVQYEQYGVENCPPPREGPLQRWNRRRKAKCQDTLWGYPEEFVDAPLGASVQANLQVMTTKGQAARMVLYQYDFFPGTDKLKARGKLQVAKIAAWLPTSTFAVLVEPSGKGPTLDEARRQAVWREFTNIQISIPVERVIVASPTGHGLVGPEAVLIQSNRDRQTTARGISAGGSGGSSGSGSGGAGSGNSGSGASQSPSAGGR
jgi:hypothetical protein